MLQKWRQIQGQKIASGKTVKERFGYPFIYQPGTSWEYSSAGDWLGKLVERLPKTPLNMYMNNHIGKPLGANEITFRMDERHNMEQKMADMSTRDPAGSRKAVWTGNETMAEEQTEDMGGGGAFASPADYMKIIHSLLINDGKLLNPETVDLMFTPQLNEVGQDALMKKLEVPMVNNILGGLPLGAQKNWGPAGLMVWEDLEGWRRKGTLTWVGMPGLTWISWLGDQGLSCIENANHGFAMDR